MKSNLVQRVARLQLKSEERNGVADTNWPGKMKTFSLMAKEFKATTQSSRDASRKSKSRSRSKTGQNHGNGLIAISRWLALGSFTFLTASPRLCVFALISSPPCPASSRCRNSCHAESWKAATKNGIA